MPLAVAMWRFVTYFDSNLPSMHDWVTGAWRPNSAEAAAGLRPGDFCTAMALVQAQIDLHASPGNWAAIKRPGATGA